jgi:uncharacterized protein YbjT (DUF2867 family)
VRILVTGVSGYIGGLLVAPLLADGHDVCGLSRHPGGVELPIPVFAGDALSGAGLGRSLHGVDVAYYLIHSMEPASERALLARETQAARRFGIAARGAGVRRIIYLGGIAPAQAPVSRHLESRLGVERILLQAVPGSVAFRASIVIGARSRSFRFLVRLIERLPVLVLPAWHANRTAPVDERDVVAVLRSAATSPLPAGLSLDLPGPEVVSYAALITRIRDHMLLRRDTVTLRSLTVTPIASRVSAVISGERHELVGPLMESLQTDLLPRDDRALRMLAVRRHSLDAAIEHALREWEMSEPLAAR